MRSRRPGSASSHPGEPAVLPFGADVGAGPDDRVQAELVRDVEEPAEIREAVEEGARRGRLMHVPGHIGLDGAAAEGDQAQEPVAPLVGGVDPEVVDRTGDDQVLLPTAEQAVGG